jgi:hypothetical protein
VASRAIQGFVCHAPASTGSRHSIKKGQHRSLIGRFCDTVFPGLGQDFAATLSDRQQ